jgi:hypothetical protein
MAHPIRLVAAVALLLLAGVAVTPAVADDTDSSRLTWSVSPADAEGSDGRARLEYLVEPGTEVRDHVVVRNLGSETITIELAALDARQTPDNAFELLAPDERSARVGAWIKLDASTVRVSPRNETVVGFSLTLPPDAEPGDHAGGIVAVSTATAADGPDVQYRVGTRAYVRVVGPISAAVELDRLDGSFAASPALVTPGILTVDASLSNVGNIRLTPTAQLRVTSLFDLWSATQPLTGLGEVLPGGTIADATTLTDVPPFGPLWITLELPQVESLGQEIASEVAFEHRTVMVWAAPWAWPMGAVVVLGVGLLTWRCRSLRRRSTPAPLAEP